MTTAEQETLDNRIIQELTDICLTPYYINLLSIYYEHYIH